MRSHGLFAVRYISKNRCVVFPLIARSVKICPQGGLRPAHEFLLVFVSKFVGVCVAIQVQAHSINTMTGTLLSSAFPLASRSLKHAFMTIIAFSASLAIAQSADNTPQWSLGFNNQHTGQSPYYAAQQSRLMLSVSLLLSGYIMSPVIGPDGTVYVGPAALNGTTGALVWQLPNNVSIVSGYAMGTNGLLYGLDYYSGNLLAVSSSSGNFVWQSSVYLGEMGIQTSPTVSSDGTVYVGNYLLGELYAIDGLTGKVRWQTNGVVGVGLHPAVDAKGVIYIASANATVYAIAPVDGSILWSVASQVTSELVIGPNGVLYTGFVSALNATTGARLWYYITPGTYGALAPNGILYWTTESRSGYGINAFDSATGYVLWSYQSACCTSTSVALGKDGTVYVGLQNDTIFALDGETGFEKWSVSASAVSGPAIGANGAVYFTVDQAGLRAYH